MTANKVRIENFQESFQNNKTKNQTKYKLFILMGYTLLNLMDIRIEFLLIFKFHQRKIERDSYINQF